MSSSSSSSSSSPPTNKIERAHQMYRDGRYEKALVFYTHALSLAKTKAQKIALHSNRAACYLKLHDFNKAAQECTSVLELDHQHTGALMLRAQTLVTLKEYHSAFFDVTRLLELNPSSEVYQNLQARLKTQLSLAPIPEIEELEEEEENKDQWEMNEDIKDTSHKEDSATSILRIDKVLKLGVGDTGPANITQMHANESTELRKNGTFDQEKVTKAQRNSAEQRKDSSEQHSKGWQSIPKPKGHSALDYGRWDSVEDDSSEEDDDNEDEESQPQFRFRVRTIGMRPVK